VNTSHPDIAKIQAAVQAALKPAKATKSVAATKGTTSTQGSKSAHATPSTGAAKPPPASQGTTGGAIGSMNAGYAANQADDLGSAC
jgi:hypothetical protein